MNNKRKSFNDTHQASNMETFRKKSLLDRIIFFSCCKSEDHVDNSIPSPNNMEDISNTRKSSLIEISNIDKFYKLKHTDPNNLNNDLDNHYPTDDLYIYNNGKSYIKNQLFILGEASQKILAKITQVNLHRVHGSTSTQVGISNKSSMLSIASSISSYNKDDSGGGHGNGNGKIKHKEKNNAKQRNKDTGLVIEERIGELKYAKSQIFSLYNKGIKVDNWEEITPEIIADHIAQRLKCPMLIDALCGVGGNAISFAKYSQFVLGIDIDPIKASYAKHNAEIYNISNKIDFLIADFLTIRNLNANVVFIAPSIIKPKSNEKFSIFEHLIPNMIDITGKALEISYSLVFKLPKYIDFDELPVLFNKSFIKHETYSKRFCIEIEIIYVDQEIDSYIVYFGDCSSVSHDYSYFDLIIPLFICEQIDPDEEYKKIYEFISDNELMDWNKKFLLETVKKILEKVGLHKSLKYIFSLSDLLCINGSYHESLFDSYIQLIANENILTKEDIKKLDHIEHCKINNSHNSNSNTNNTNNNINTIPIIQQSYNNPSSLNYNNLINIKSLSSFGDNTCITCRLNGGINDDIVGINENEMKKKNNDNNVLNNGENSKRTSKLVSKLHHQPSILSDLNDIKNGIDLNDLQLSDYSVDSGFFNDSFSDVSMSPVNNNTDIPLVINNNDLLYHESQAKEEKGDPKSNNQNDNDDDNNNDNDKPDEYELTYYNNINESRIKDKKERLSNKKLLKKKLKSIEMDPEQLKMKLSSFLKLRNSLKNINEEKNSILIQNQKYSKSIYQKIPNNDYKYNSNENKDESNLGMQ